MNYFFEQYLVDLVYGLGFFLIGYSIIIVQPARIAKCTLSRHLWLLAMFGIFHGLGEWARPLSSLPLAHDFAKPLVHVLAPLFISASFLFLLFFGVSLLKDFIPSKIISKGIPYLLIIIWVGVTLSCQDQNIPFFWNAKAWSRYILGFPGALLTSLAFLLHYRELRKSSSDKHRGPQNNISVIGFFSVFLFYALFSLVGQHTPLLPIILPNSDSFTHFTGIPVEIVRTLFAVAILLITLKTLNTFYVVHSDKLQSALKQQTINDAKAKISQDLHDVTIQSIYATGLRLKYLKRKFNSDYDSNVDQLDYCINSLNNTIKHLRFYITALEYPEFYEDGLKNTISEIVEEFKNDNHIKCELVIEGSATKEFPLVHLHQIVQIIKESLTNISKHAQPTEVIVKLSFNQDSVEILVIDNGIGFCMVKYKKNQENSSLKEENSFGLKNMEERARNIDAQVSIFSQPGLGTKVQLIIPYGGDRDGKNKVVNS